MQSEYYLLYFTVYVFSCVSGNTFIPSKTCYIIHSCACSFGNGSVLDLSALVGNPRFTLDDPQVEYAYNPCTDFSMGECTNVSACQYLRYEDTYHILGDQESAAFVFDTDNEMVILTYYKQDTYGKIRTANIQLHCTTDMTDSFIYLGQHKQLYFKFRLSSRHCCPMQPRSAINWS
ncbi:unnamed protein product [Lymnaea stagnalis]|uniref:Uncharacterized protein n=1 Tax=Lymnaea stagnalis TaxID=6523 RepID=A0AAV2IG67_LYMST